MLLLGCHASSQHGFSDRFFQQVIRVCTLIHILWLRLNFNQDYVVTAEYKVLVLGTMCETLVRISLFFRILNRLVVCIQQSPPQLSSTLTQYLLCRVLLSSFRQFVWFWLHHASWRVYLCHGLVVQGYPFFKTHTDIQDELCCQQTPAE
jgi:hypothetical protein